MTHRTKSWLPILAVALGVFLLIPLAVSAGDLTAGPAPGDCMKTLAGVTLNCTANDIRLAKATSASCSGSGCSGPSSCIAGEYFDLTVTFQVDVTANQRYDAGFYFDVSGDAENDGAYTGSCFLAVLDRGTAPALNLDGDFCGDLNAGSYPNVTFTIPHVLCADNGGGHLKLPNCTSWHSNARTDCSTATDATPETKSKCSCDKNFSVDAITVESPAGAVTKTATSATVTYEVIVKNNSTTRTVTVDKLVDDSHGDITTSGHDGIQTTNCSTGATLAPGASTSACQFTVAATSSSSSQIDTVTATLTTTTNPITSIDVSGQATVVVILNGTCP